MNFWCFFGGFLGGVRVILKPNPAVVPKVVGLCSPIDLVVLVLLLKSSQALCPVCALHSYMDKTRGLGRSDQLFISWPNPCKGKPGTKQCPSYWMVEAIAFAYSSQGL